jgi:hypothetical protein
MTTLVNSKLDFGGARRITNLAQGAAAGEPVTFDQLNAAIEAVAWKDNVRVRAGVNVTLSAPGATIDGVTMVAGDRFLAPAQTVTTENGLYLWNGAAVPATRTADASTFDELENAFVPVDEGTSAGTTWRQTQVNGVIGTNSPVFASAFSTSAAASETVSGIMELATQAETDTGTDDLRAVTPLKLATWSNRAKRYAASFGDGSATSYVITHNLNTLDVQVYVYENGGSKREVFVEKQHTSVNSVTIVCDTAPAASAYRVVVVA